jgi:hypothetical protein
MAKKKFKISELSDEARMELLSQRRIRVLSKYINKHYLENDKWLTVIGASLKAIIKYEILKGLDEEFDILRDDPEDPLIIELVREKTELIIEQLYKDNGIPRSKLN